MFLTGLFVGLLALAFVYVLIRLFLYRSALIFVLRKWKEWIADKIHVHQYFRVPELNELSQENQLYRKVLLYVNSLASLEDSDFTNLFSGKNPNDIVLSLDDNQVVHDTFLGAKLSWMNKVEKRENHGTFCRSLVLRIKKKDKRRILRPYLQHIHTVCDDIEQRRRESKLFINNLPPTSHQPEKGRWRSVPFTHPSSFDTIAMDSDLKHKVKSDLEAFLKSKSYYHKLGRVWKRSYLLYGPSGTGKSSFVAAMANFLGYDVYDIDLHRVADDSDLKTILLQTSAKSLIVIEDLDRFFVNEKSNALSLSGILNFMDGIVNSCCGGEKVMVFTMNTKEQIDPAMLRPGRIDVHIYFPLCNFSSFKSLASNYLGVKEHKLFPLVAEMFQTGASMSQAEIGELMLMNRSSPNRALKSVITALQSSAEEGRNPARTRRLNDSAAASPALSRDDSGSATWKDSVPVAKEFRKLYGMLRMKSCKRSEALDHDAEIIER